MKPLFLINLLLFFSLKTLAQEDSLLNSLLTESPEASSYSSSAFKGTRLINSHTVEMLGKKSLEFRVAHRFGDVRDGSETFWGLDNANMNITLDYSITDNFTVGAGRNSLFKLVEVYGKYRLLRQKSDNSIPVSVVLLGKGNMLTNTDGPLYDDPVNALSYYSELIIGRKFNKMLSLQVSPGFIHINLAPEELKSNDIYTISAAGRFKFTRSVAFTAEYSQPLNNYYYREQAKYIPTFSAGFDLETGGHVFQLFFTNAVALNETQYIPFTSSDWGRREFRFGFNISRVFGLGGKNKKASY